MPAPDYRPMSGLFLSGLSGEAMRTPLFLLMLLVAGCNRGQQDQSGQVAPTGAESAKASSLDRPKATLIKDSKADGHFGPKDGQIDYLVEYSGGSVLEKLSQDCGASIVMRYHGPTWIQGLKKNLSVHELIFRCKGEAPVGWWEKLRPALRTIELKDKEGNSAAPWCQFAEDGKAGMVRLFGIPKNDPRFEGPGGFLTLRPTQKSTGSVHYFFVLPSDSPDELTAVLPRGAIEINVRTF
jgi:hypothetical protein